MAQVCSEHYAQLRRRSNDKAHALQGMRLIEGSSFVG